MLIRTCNLKFLIVYKYIELFPLIYNLLFKFIFIEIKMKANS